ncbi:hypothetical protein Pmar_PMAR010111 [Perkinsus marinus ATCC 50983]|uniref:Uncharacterized protein n=1 Tax=Perkinsus marinus (strain ATCC 50983 / TXsc) TaxID=423536 RepID=C5K4V6_PERM5|nr:hypothetical protein Pmar_PMAR010111 [Perkinsus marinus ATCC 50983]EER20378.1 hypothetical protein Pmar_PMAR010111 [Perkinsus marinus ATCC 50983]|eukprot:XP_002788582.1 hypothetical protein Pmar_PMAR010111 [Perkinsus marinus ATCC 50983]
MGCSQSAPVEDNADLSVGGRSDADVQCCLIGGDEDDLIREWMGMAMEEWRGLRTLYMASSACIALEEIEAVRTARLAAIDSEVQRRHAELDDNIAIMKEARVVALEKEMKTEKERVVDELNEWCVEERTARMRSMLADFSRREAELDGRVRDHERALKERIADLDESQRRAIQLLVQATP